MGRHYVGPDVSLERTSVRLLDEADAIVWRGNVAWGRCTICSKLHAKTAFWSRDTQWMALRVRRFGAAAASRVNQATAFGVRCQAEPHSVT